MSVERGKKGHCGKQSREKKKRKALKGFNRRRVMHR